MEKLFAEIETTLYSGRFKVNEIIGSIVSVNIEGHSYDCYLGNGEIKKFVTEDGKNARL